MASPRVDTMDSIHQAGLAMAAIIDRATRERRSPRLASFTIDAAPAFFTRAPMQGDAEQVAADFRVFASSFRVAAGQAMLAADGRDERDVLVYFSRSRNDLVLSVAELRDFVSALDQLAGALEHSATP